MRTYIASFFVRFTLLLVAIAGIIHSAHAQTSASGFPSRPTFTDVRVGRVAAKPTTNQLEVQAASGVDPIIATFRNANTNGFGIGRWVFDANNASAARVTYARIQGETVTTGTGTHSGRVVVSTVSGGVLNNAAIFDSNGDLIVSGNVSAANIVSGSISTTPSNAGGAITVFYARSGNVATICYGASIGVSAGTIINTAASTLLPAVARPAAARAGVGWVRNNSVNVVGTVTVNADGSIAWGPAFGSSAFAGGGVNQQGPQDNCMSYTIN